MTPPAPTVAVLVVGDRELIRTGARGILHHRRGFTVVGELDTGAGIVESVARTGPDVVVMDVRTPGTDGVAATRALTRTDAAPPVLVLTSVDDEEVLAPSLCAGAAGFLLEDAPAGDLRRAVRTLAAGGAWLDPGVAGRVLAGYRTGVRPVRPGTRVGLLTPREKDVLALVGAALSNAEIAAELNLGEGTVKTHIGHVFAKLGLRDRAAAIVFAFDHGLARPGDPRGTGPAARDGRRPRAQPAPSPLRIGPSSSLGT